MTILDFNAAEAQLDDLVDRAAAGEEFIITKAGEPIARLMPLASQPRRLDVLDGDRDA